MNHISCFNTICRICCVNSCMQNLKIWLKSVLSMLKYRKGLFLMMHPVQCIFSMPSVCPSNDHMFHNCLNNCHILQFLHQIFSVSTLLLDDAFKPATPLITEMLRQFVPLSDISQGSVATHLRCGVIVSN